MTANNEDDSPSIGISDFFENKSIFITGGSGFMGKVLIEKLLRSCPGIDTIYILIRNKNNKDKHQRLADLTDIPLFDVLKQKYPDFIERKLVAISGDVMELDLGISAEDRKTLEDNISVVFHVAASVRFDDTLKYACIMNVRGTREVMKLISGMKKLTAFTHVSTTYCNSDKKVVEEKLYPPLADWKETIRIVENGNAEVLKVLTPLYTNHFPNTYTFTKNLAEHVVNDLSQEFNIPSVIFRPSIVISTIQDPIPGWIDNFNGPVGLMAASGKGILRSVYCDPEIISDYIPVDIAIRALVVVTWKKAIERTENFQSEVYNCSSYSVKAVTTGQMIEMAKVIGEQYPLNGILWYPGGGVTKYKWWNYIQVLLFHLLPALVVDVALKISGRKTMLLKIQRKIYIANMALGYFIANQWYFINERLIKANYQILEKDGDDWNYHFKDTDVVEFFINCVKGARLYLFKESNESIPQARIQARRMYWLDKIVKGIFWILLFYVIFFKIEIHNVITSYVGQAYTDFVNDLSTI